MSDTPARLSYEEFKRIYSRVPRLCVDLIVKNDRGVLLIEREINPLKGFWHFPGGTVLLGESIDAAIKRVASAETNLTPGDCRLMGYMEFSEPENPVFHTVSLVFSVQNYSGEIRGGEQGRRLAFHKAIPDKIIPEHKQFLSRNNLMEDNAI